MSSDGMVAAAFTEPPDASLSDQTRPPDGVFSGERALSDAIESELEWIWLVERGAHPQRDTLERLMDGVKPSHYPSAALVAGMVRDRDGRPVADRLPAPQLEDGAAVVGLVEQRLLPIRNAPFANCLIRNSCFAAYGLPDFGDLGPYAPVAWTANVLRRAPGYFAPLGVVHIDAPRRGGDFPATTRYTIRMTRSGAWTGGESLRAVAGLVARLLGPLGP